MYLTKHIQGFRFTFQEHMYFKAQNCSYISHNHFHITACFTSYNCRGRLVGRKTNVKCRNNVFLDSLALEFDQWFFKWIPFNFQTSAGHSCKFYLNQCSWMEFFFDDIHKKVKRSIPH